MSTRGPADWFPSTQSRSRGVMLAITVVIVVETLGLHLWLRQRHPYVAWSLTCLSILALVWLARDYAAPADAGLELGPEGCSFQVGRRARAQVPWALVEQVQVPNWRDLPQAAGDYLNAARPDDPNLLFSFRSPVSVRSVLGLRKVHRLGVRVANADKVVQRWEQARGASSSLT